MPFLVVKSPSPETSSAHSGASLGVGGLGRGCFYLSAMKLSVSMFLKAEYIVLKQK